MVVDPNEPPIIPALSAPTEIPQPPPWPRFLGTVENIVGRAHIRIHNDEAFYARAMLAKRITVADCSANGPALSRTDEQLIARACAIALLVAEIPEGSGV